MPRPGRPQATATALAESPTTSTTVPGHLYFRDGDRQVRRRVADNQDDAARIAAQVNAQLLNSAPTLLAFSPVSLAELRCQFLDYHEQVQRSSLATLSRYRAATKHLEDFVASLAPTTMAHQLRPQEFVAYLRGLRVAPNGHPNTARRPLRDKGIRYILECCRSMYSYAGRMRHLPPYATNPFADLHIDRMKVQDSKPVFVFTAETELAFLRAADDWSFAIHLTLAKTGLRPAELAHLLIEDLDLQGGWLHVRGKPELGWRIKTGRDRAVPNVSASVRPDPQLREVMILDPGTSAQPGQRALMEPVAARYWVVADVDEVLDPILDEHVEEAVNG